MTPRDVLLRPSDVERDYGIAEGTLKSWRHKTRLDGVQRGPVGFHLGGRRIVYRRSVVEAWIASAEASAAPAREAS